jgi:hypothetical protein
MTCRGGSDFVFMAREYRRLEKDSTEISPSNFFCSTSSQHVAAVAGAVENGERVRGIGAVEPWSRGGGEVRGKWAMRRRATQREDFIEE